MATGDIDPKDFVVAEPIFDNCGEYNGPSSGKGKKKAKGKKPAAKPTYKYVYPDEEDYNDDDVEAELPGIPKLGMHEVPAPVGFNNLTDEQKIWSVIKIIGWENRDEKNMDLGAVSNLLNYKISEAERDAVKTVYPTLYAPLYEILSVVYAERKNVYIDILTSHIIALGSDWYNLIKSDPSLSEWLVEQELYQNFKSCIDNMV